ncbi:MAG: SGNH/GDSL hydrolase family protein [Pseudomonadota bacterium]
MKGILVKSCVYAAICFLFASISTASAATYSNLIVFGDSLSDAASLSVESNMKKDKENGNNTWVKTQGKTGAPITNIDFASKNSSLWPNDLISDATLFEANPNASRIIYPSSQAAIRGYSPLRYSINYAWASAETGDHYINDLNAAYPYNDQACQTIGPGEISPTSSCVPGVLLQVKRYLTDVEYHPNPRSLIIIWAGGNDIFNNIAKVAAQNQQDSKPMLVLKMLNVPFPLLPTKAGNEPLSYAVKNLKQATVMLLKAGVPAQNIYVINLPNLANTPAAQDFVKGNKSLLYALTAITEIFNTTLRIDLAFNYMSPGYNILNGHIISVHRSFGQILKDPQTFGFDKILNNCVQDGATPYCQGYLFFNGKHPTTQAHQWMADEFKKILSVNQ